MANTLVQTPSTDTEKHGKHEKHTPALERIYV